MLANWNIFEIGLYCVWRRKAQKAAETDGSFVETHSRPFISGALSVTYFAAGILAIFSMMGKLAPFIIIVLGVGIMGIIWARKSLSKKPKEDETPLKSNLSMVATVLCIMVLQEVYSRMRPVLVVHPLHMRHPVQKILWIKASGACLKYSLQLL